MAIPATELGLYEAERALWAEAKAGVRKDIHESFVQLILTIGRARTFDAERPPIFLGAFGTADISDDRVATDFFITFNANGKNKYRIQRKNADESSIELTFGFKGKEGLDAYATFWSRYKRPPRKDYWNDIVKRIDLLVPQDCFDSHFMSDFLAGKADDVSGDEEYNERLAALRQAMKKLAAKIEPKVYEYGFLRKWGFADFIKRVGTRFPIKRRVQSGRWRLVGVEGGKSACRRDSRPLSGRHCDAAGAVSRIPSAKNS